MQVDLLIRNSVVITLIKPKVIS